MEKVSKDRMAADEAEGGRRGASSNEGAAEEFGRLGAWARDRASVFPGVLSDTDNVCPLLQ